MADYKAIMTLALSGHSYSEIVAAAGCSRREIAAVKKTITEFFSASRQATRDRRIRPRSPGCSRKDANASRKTMPDRILIGFWRR